MTCWAFASGVSWLVGPCNGPTNWCITPSTARRSGISGRFFRRPCRFGLSPSGFFLAIGPFLPIGMVRLPSILLAAGPFLAHGYNDNQEKRRSFGGADVPKKRKKSSRSKTAKLSAPAKFTTGTKVRVKMGTTVPDFEDFPLGGWSGTIAEVEEGRPGPTYLIEWDRRTLDAMHPVYRNRCERDGLGLESMWLGEDDIEPDIGEVVPIEQPTQIITRPLRLNDQEDRIRAILGVTSDDPLPDVEEETLGKYPPSSCREVVVPLRGQLRGGVRAFPGHDAPDHRDGAA